MPFPNPFHRSVQQRDGLPIMRGAFPLVGHLPIVYRDMPRALREAREELGPVFWLTTGFDSWLLFCTGSDSVGILRSRSFSSRHLPKVSPLVAGESVLSQDGEAHRRVRGALNKPFLPRGLSAVDVGSRMSRSLVALTERWAERGAARVLPDIQETALDIIFSMLGVVPDELPGWRRHYRDLLLANLGISARFPGSPASRAAHAKRWIDARLRALIDASRNAPSDGTLLGALARAEDDAGQRLTDAELVDNLRLLALGGHETISSVMAWIVVTLARRSDLWDTLLVEAKRGSAVPATPEEARAFPFAEALFREAVRVHPPFGSITRMAEEDVEFAGRRIPKGTIVAVDLWGASHDRALFDDPEDFAPSRWLGRSGPPTPLEICQFGTGPHFCLGYHLAWLEAAQFSIALALSMSRRGVRPRLAGELPRPVYLPTEHPPARTRVRFA